MTTPRNDDASLWGDGDGKSVLLAQLKAQYSGNSTATQRDLIMAALSVVSLSTVEAVRALDIIRPGARISELRHKFGQRILTTWAEEATEYGELHRVARYVLEQKSEVR